MTHIRYLASDELEGRESPEAVRKAADYISAFAKKYGLEGANPGDPTSPYYQTFQVWGFGDTDHESHPTGERPRLFERGFYLDSTLTEDDLRLIDARYREHAERQGQVYRPILPGGGGKTTRQKMLTELATRFDVRGQMQNVVAKLPGSGPRKDEVIIVMAHYDHVGKRGRNIYNGADDNASGTSALMASIPHLAEAAAKGELDRTVLFLWTAAEEKGLVGAEYFAKHPLPGIPLESIAGVINMDMVGRLDPERISFIDTTRGKRNWLHEVHERANQNLEDPFDHVKHDVDNLVNRQDGWVFSKRGIDVLMVFEGLTDRGGLNPDYHKPTDTVEAMERDNGGAKARKSAELLAEVVKIAAGPEAD